MNERPQITQKIAPKITQEMIKIYDDYTHLTLDRRDFMNKLKRLTGRLRPLRRSLRCWRRTRRVRRSFPRTMRG